MRAFSRFSAHHSAVVLSFGTLTGADLVTVGGCFDINTHQHVRDRVLERESFAQLRLLLDLHDVELLDSSGIGALVLMHRALRERGTELVLVTESRHQRKLFRIAGLDQVLEVHDSVDAALAGPSDGEPVSAG